MRITFEQNGNQIKTEQKWNQEQTKAASKAARGNAVFYMDGKDRVGLPGQDKSQTFEDIQNQAGHMDLENRQDGLIVASNTMSDEDYAKMLKEGYEPSDMTPEETVTILDKIKAELLKSGKHVAGYTDDIDMDTLVAAVGSQGLAQSLQTAFESTDVPMTPENVDKVMQALELGQALHTPTESEMYHMVVSGMDTTIQDFYMAQATAGQLPMAAQGQYFGEAVKGYVTKNVTSGEASADNMTAQIENLFGKLEIQVTEETMEQAKWLIDKGLPITEETMNFLGNVADMTFPPEDGDIVESAVRALADGLPAKEGNLAQKQTRIEKAIEIYNLYHGEAAKDLIHDRRTLEEIRLHMTVETNLKLLDSGFSIDTASIEETIEALKMAEESIAKQYFPNSETPVENYRSLEKATHIIKSIPELPFKTVVDFATRISQVTVSQFHESGTATEAAYKQAGEAYELIGTTPRTDLGDSIKKAFGNVDALLTELGYELNEENRKAMRGLGYNSMELTVENMEKVKEANRQVLEVVAKMTPAKTLEMIRDGYNPLDSTFEELNAYLDSRQASVEMQEEKYSRFLQRLDHAGEITAEEREAFIGCYRLMRQIEKADGAATGSIIRTGVELTFANLLSAVRSGKYKGMDAKVTDTVGEVCQRIMKESSISEQIEKAFAKQMRQDYAQATAGAAEVSQMLELSGMKLTTENLLAAGRLKKEPGKVLSEVEKRAEKKEKRNNKLEKLAESDSFKQEYVSELEEYSQEITQECFEQTTAVDVKAMQLLSKQMHIMKNLAENDEFFFGMEIQGEQVNVHLRMEQSAETQGLIEIQFTGENFGTINGSLQVTDTGVEGFFVGNRKDVVMNLRSNADIINNQVAKEWNLERLEFVYSETYHTAGRMPRKATEVQYSTQALYGLAKDFLQGLKAAGENGGITDEN
ncbi:MAG: hypothetical protein IJ324_06775 [Lachnospiraceae bacterium]|nr:hypothetical protein [Lachnospiraceae bacterium]